MNIETVTKILDCALSGLCDEVFDQNFLKKNLLFERVLCQSGSEQQYCQENEQRVNEFEQLIQNIANYCRENDIRYYLPKAYQHYPDMGHDIDLFIDIKGDKLKGFVQHFQLTEDESSFLNKVAGKHPYLFNNTIPLETHRFAGHFGEFKQLTKAYYDNLVIERGVNQLCDEHKLLNQIVQRFYGHFTIRLSDIIYTITLLNKGIDLGAVDVEASRYGIKKALHEYLGFIFSNFGDYIKSNDYSNYENKKFGYIHLSKDMFVIDKNFALRLFAIKSLSDLTHFRVFSLTRLATAPLVLIAMVIRRIFNKG